MSLASRCLAELSGVASAAAMPLQVCAAAHGDVRVYTRDGELERTFPVARGPCQLVAAGAATLAVLSGGQCVVYSTATRRSVARFPTTSAVAVAAARCSHGDDTKTRVAVLSKRKLRWLTVSGAVASKVEQLAMPDRPRALALTPDARRAVCAVGSAVIMVDLVDRVVVELDVRVPSSLWSAAAVSIACTEHNTALSVDATVTVVSPTGKVVTRFKCANTPLALDTLDGWLLCLYPGMLELRDFASGSRVAHAAVSGARGLANSGVWWNASSVNIATFAVDADTVISLAAEDQELAVEVISRSPEIMANKDVSKLYNEYATQVFDNGDYARGLRLLTKIGTPVAEVVELLGSALDKVETEAARSPSGLVTDASSVLSTHTVTSVRTSAPRNPVTDPIVAYLASARRKINIDAAVGSISPEDAAEQLTAIDTALFRLYLALRSPLVVPLVRARNHCDPRVVQDRLQQLGKWRELVMFLKSKGLDERALTLLSEHGTRKDVTDYLVDANPEFNVLKRFAREPINSSPELARTLLYDRELPVLEVYDFLSSINGGAACNYLEYLVNDKSNTDPEVHNKLALAYFHQKDGHALQKFLETSRSYDPGFLLSLVSQDQPVIRAVLYGRAGDYRKAINLHLTGRDVSGAKALCARMLLETPPLGREALTYLFQQVSSGIPEELTALLNEQGQYLPLQAVLEHLPNATRAATLCSYLTSQCAAVFHDLCTEELKEGIGKVALTELSYDLAYSKKQKTLVTPLTVCSQCKRRLGTSLAKLFDGKVFHYGCLST